MRVYLHFNQYNQAYVVHQMAVYWNQQYGWSEFAGTVIVKDSRHYDFLCNQKQIPYKKIDVIDEWENEALNYEVSADILDKWERRLDIPLWQLVVADRNIGHHFVNGGVLVETDIMRWTSHQHLQKFVCYFLEHYEKSLKDFRPDFVFLPAIASLHALALVKVCEFLKIPYYVPSSSRIGDYYIVSENNVVGRSLAVEKDVVNKDPDVQQNMSQDMQRYAQSFFTQDPKRPAWFENQNALLSQYKNESLVKFWLPIIKSFILLVVGCLKTNSQKRYLRKKRGLSNFWVDFRRKFIIRYFSYENVYDEVSSEDKYIYYPLHLDPEASTMVYAPNFVNQEFVIDMLAKNIPISHKLYVKEHYTMVGRRPRGFYERLAKHPNVKLIKPQVQSLDLIKNSSLVVVVTGTAGWEAIMSMRPVLTLGQNFYSELGLSKRCSDVNQLSELIKSCLFNEIDFSASKAKIECVLEAVEKNAIQMKHDFIWGKIRSENDLTNDVKIVIASLADKILDTHKMGFVDS